MDVEAEVARIRALRLRAQGLVVGAQGWATAPEVAHGMLAMQAQDGAGVRWAMSMRARSRPGDGAVLADLRERRIAYNRPSRGTLQVTAPQDMAWLTATMSPRSRAAAAKRREQIGLSDDMLARGGDLVREAVAEGPRTRGEIAQAIADAGLDLDGTQFGHVLRDLTETMAITYASPSGKDEKYADGEAWLGKPAQVSRTEALGRIAERFVAARGPVTRTDLARWANLSMADADLGLSLAAPERMDLAGESYLLAPGSAALAEREIAASLAQPLLLAPFDEYLIGYGSRDPLIDPEHLPRVVPGKNGMFKPIVVVGGEVVATWSRRLTRQRIAIEVAPFARMTKKTLSALEVPARAFGDFVGVPAEVHLAR